MGIQDREGKVQQMESCVPTWLFSPVLIKSVVSWRSSSWKNGFVPEYHSLRYFGDQNFLFTLLIYLASDQVWKQTPSLLDKYLHCVSISTGIHQHHELSAFKIKATEMFITCFRRLLTFLLIVVLPQLSIGCFCSFSHSSCSLSTSFSI